MKTFLIINKQTLDVVGSYVSASKKDTSADNSWMMVEPFCSHVELPNDVDLKYAKGVLVQGQVEVIHSDEKEEADIEAAWENLRQERNRKLSECDWTQLADAPISAGKKTEWQTYREELRDFPQQVGDPRQPQNWPTKPN